MDLDVNKGYLSGSYESYGYLVIMDRLATKTKSYKNSDGELMLSTITPIQYLKTNERIVLFPSKTMMGYETKDLTNTWHLVQFSRASGLFQSEYDAKIAVEKHLSSINNANRKASVDTFTLDELNVEIKKIRFECSMQFV